MLACQQEKLSPCCAGYAHVLPFFHKQWQDVWNADLGCVVDVPGAGADHAPDLRARQAGEAHQGEGGRSQVPHARARTYPQCASVIPILL